MGKSERRYSPKPYKSDHPLPLPIASPTPLANLSLNSVVLHDWWLGMAKPRGLVVGGFECKGRQGKRLLCSAAIAKRHDATTLETADGITIAISGFINTSRTLQNGFPPEVCSHFLFGFPYDWEEYASQCSSNEESVCCGTQASITALLGFNRSSRSNAISFLPPSVDNLPARRICDLLMFAAGDYQKSILKRTIFDHMLEKLSTHASQNASITDDSNMGNKYSAADGENSNCHKKIKVIQNHMDDNNMAYSRSKRRVESENKDQSMMGLSILTPTIGVITRSMTRLKHLTEKQNGVGVGLVSKSSVKHIKEVQLSSSESRERYCEAQAMTKTKTKTKTRNLSKQSLGFQHQSEPGTKSSRKIATRSACFKQDYQMQKDKTVPPLSSPEAIEKVEMLPY